MKVLTEYIQANCTHANHVYICICKHKYVSFFLYIAFTTTITSPKQLLFITYGVHSQQLVLYCALQCLRLNMQSIFSVQGPYYCWVADTTTQTQGKVTKESLLLMARYGYHGDQPTQPQHPVECRSVRGVVNTVPSFSCSAFHSALALPCLLRRLLLFSASVSDVRGKINDSYWRPHVMSIAKSQTHIFHFKDHATAIFLLMSLLTAAV